MEWTQTEHHEFAIELTEPEYAELVEKVRLHYRWPEIQSIHSIIIIVEVSGGFTYQIEPAIVSLVKGYGKGDGP